MVLNKLCDADSRQPNPREFQRRALVEERINPVSSNPDNLMSEKVDPRVVQQRVLERLKLASASNISAVAYKPQDAPAADKKPTRAELVEHGQQAAASDPPAVTGPTVEAASASVKRRARVVLQSMEQSKALRDMYHRGQPRSASSSSGGHRDDHRSQSARSGPTETEGSGFGSVQSSPSRDDTTSSAHGSSRRHQQGRTEEVRKEEAEDYVEEPYEEVEDYMEEEEEGEHEENGSPGRGRYYGETQSSHRDDRAHPGLNRSKQDSRAAEEEEEEEEQEERQHEGDEDMGEEEEEEEEEGGQSPVNFRSTLAALRGELNISATALHPPRPPPRTQPLREAPPQMPPSHRGSLRDLPGQLSHVSAGISEFAEEVTPVHEHDVRHALQVAHASSDAARNYARAMQGINQEAGAGHGAVRRGSPAKSTPLKLTPSVSGGPSPPGSAVSAASNRSAHISEEELAMPYAERRRARDGEGSAAGSASGSPAPSPRLQPRSPSGVSGSPALSPRLQPRSNGAVVPAGLEGGAAVGPLAPRGSPDALVQLRAENRLLQEELKQAQLASAGAEADRMELEQQLQTMRRLQARPVTHEALVRSPHSLACAREFIGGCEALAAPRAVPAITSPLTPFGRSRPPILHVPKLEVPAFPLFLSS
ncbi:hypothetical protein CYMTET_52549, partial [Cymbomonas tetramitiformis]